MRNIIQATGMALAIATSLFVAPVVAQDAASADADRVKKAQAKLSTCAGCHDISAERKAVFCAPLFGIIGRKPQAEGIPFETWDAKSLDKWLQDPCKVKEGSPMTFKIRSDKKRKEAIEALKDLH